MKRINVTDCVHHGNGITYTFDDNSVVEIVHSDRIRSDVNEAQQQAIIRHMNNSRGSVNTDLRFEYGFDDEDTLPTPHVEVASLDAAVGIVYFDNPSGLQIEVHKFTRHNRGPHENNVSGRVYSDRQGKRYHPFNLITYGATSWKIPSSLHRRDKRNYLKFATYDPITGERGTLSTVTVVVTSLRDQLKTPVKAVIDDIH